MTHSNVADYDMIYETQTERAVAVKRDSDDDETIWLPKSQVEFDGKQYRRGEIIRVTIPDWLAEKNDLA